VALALICFVAAVAYVGRGGYEDADGNALSVLDAFYYATVSITTTGYGDVRPVTPGARLATTLLITPARILFLILLVGTTVEILAERTREALELRRWRRRLRGHVVICGFGTKGRAAWETLCNQGWSADNVVVIDHEPAALVAASAHGLATVHGDAARVEVLRQAGAEEAKAVVVAASRDDAAVLMTLTARELNQEATIVSAVREEENAHLLRQSGADSVITSSAAAGRLLGLATHQPRVVEVLEDLLTAGHGLDIVERTIGPDEVCALTELHADNPVLAVVRNGETCRFDDPRVAHLQQGDKLVQLHSHRE